MGEQPLGGLITLEQIYEVQQSALDADVQNTLARLFNHEEVMGCDTAIQVAKAVALLELIQEQEPTTTELVSKCLYDRLGGGNREAAISEALEKLRNLSLLSYSEKLGYKIQSSAGQEWQRERDSYTVIPDAVSLIVAEKLKDLLGSVERPAHKSNTFRWTAFYSDGRQRQDERVQATNELAVVTVDFRNLGVQEERSSTLWVQASDTAALRDRLIWVIGKPDRLPSLIRDLARSRHMVGKYLDRHQSLSRDKQRLVFDEKDRCDNLESQVKDAVAQAFMDGEIYFRGRQIDKLGFGTTFATVLKRVGESVLPDLYSHYVNLAVSPAELKQLLQKTLSGPSSKFLSDGLGILELDAGKYMPTCSGQVPARIEQYIVDQNGIVGNVLLSHFGSPPFGYSVDVVKACLAGLLRAKKIRIRPESGKEITSTQDPDVENLFILDRAIRRADILPHGEGGLTARDRVAICQFFEKVLNIDLDREDEAIADAVFNYFPIQVRRLQELEQRYNRLPNRPDLPTKLNKLRQAIESSMRSRQIEDTVLAVKKHLDALREGIQELRMSLTDLTDDAVAAISRLMTIRDQQIAQLKQIEQTAQVKDAIAAVEAQLGLDRPWRDIGGLEPQLQAIEQHYQTVRLGLIEQQEQQAETIRQRLKQRQGFFKLSEEKAAYVLNPVQRAAQDTIPEAFYPNLLQIRDSVTLQLQQAEQEANLNLDNLLSQVTDKQVIQLSVNLSGREVSTPEEVEAVVQQLRERLLAQLDGKSNIRIRLI
ncbi:MAG TPA: hypothetical protein V6C84_15830 [Coleofasciculaceae cyanobacterium]